jgi:MFS family permease
LAALLVGRRLALVVFATALVLGVALSATAFGGLALVVALLVVVGGARAIFDVSVRVLLQRSVTPDRLVEVFATAEGMSMLGLAVGSLLVPALVALGGAELALVGTALVLPVLVLVRGRMVVRLDEHARVPVVEIALLRQIPLFAVLPGSALEGLAQSLENVHIEAGTLLMREGDPGDYYYAVADGEVEISQRGKVIRSVSRTGGLGEIALLRSVPRTATAVASTPVTAYRLDRESFLTAVTGHRPTMDSADALVREHESRDADRWDRT